MVQVTAQIIKKLDEQGALKEALLAYELGGGRIQCNICQRRCNIDAGGVGYCKTKINFDGVLYDTIYGLISSANADPIEKKPVFHFKPGSRCFSVGSLGCNFRCDFCQNGQIAYSDALQNAGGCKSHITPEALVQLAQTHNCQGIAWTYNEPGIWLNYTLDCAILCKTLGLYTVYVTNGYATQEHLDIIGPYLDVYRVDIKSMNDSFYQKLIKVPSVKGILDVAESARHKWNMHVECVTNIIPDWNDSEDNLRKTATWIANNLGPATPWHVTRFFPYGKLSHIPPTPLHTLNEAVKIGSECGLQFVYLGNVHSETGENTYCPDCGNLLIERSGYAARLHGITADGRCNADNTDINVHL
ncbi:MAG: AmmeMemoRadiSam system radical SAM enzyme [Armatimonadetes bacterium]|nr:AmmeMemoRadiSam system radical SAM enzyme [Armatimonadota bacterium]